MNNSILIISATMLFSSLCSATADKIIKVDVTAKYPSKEIAIQDIANIEYIPLETKVGFLTNAITHIDKKRIIGINFKTGDILIFNRSGKAVKKINRKGNGPQEYSRIINQLCFDVEKNELFVYDFSKNRILVYDENGSFKRSFELPEKGNYKSIKILNSNSLICYKSTRTEAQPYIIISKTDGSLLKKVNISFKEHQDLIIRKQTSQGTLSITTSSYPLVKWKSEFFLNEMSIDTIFKMNSIGSLTPVIVRKPSITSMSQPVFLFLEKETKNYLFMFTIEKFYDAEKKTGFPNVPLLYSKKDSKIYEYSFTNRDITAKNSVEMNPDADVYDGDAIQVLSAFNLVQRNNDKELAGKLKDVASKLNEEDNNIVVVYTFQ